jgi:hypothetical protein
VIHFAPITPDEPGYPWDFPAIHVANYPTPSMFFDLDNRRGWFQAWQGFDALVHAVLASALLLAGLDAEQGDHATSNARRLRQSTRALLTESRWNVELYGCDNENYCCGADPNKRGGALVTTLDRHTMGRVGLGLSWLPRHANNRQRMELGLPPQRTTNLHGEVLPGTVARSRAFLWIPAIDLGGLHEDRPVVRTLVREDGSLMTEPPAAVRELGIDHPTSLPGMPGFAELYKETT